MNINERIQKILASLEHTREDLLTLSDDIWSNIDHNSDEALEAGTEFKRSYNSAMRSGSGRVIDLMVGYFRFSMIRRLRCKRT